MRPGQKGIVCLVFYFFFFFHTKLETCQIDKSGKNPGLATLGGADSSKKACDKHPPPLMDFFLVGNKVTLK